MKKHLDEKFMLIAIEEAKKSLNKGEVPVGAVLELNGEVVARQHNKRESGKNALWHAEMLCIDEACKKLDSWRLDKSTMYVTLEPCIMCIGAISESRIKRLVYSAANTRNNNIATYLSIKHNHTLEIDSGILIEKSIILLNSFFKKLRDEK